MATKENSDPKLGNGGDWRTEIKPMHREEVEALKNQYSGQLEEAEDVWDNNPTNCKLRLRPHDSCFLDGDPLKKHDYKITLHVKCSCEYPNRKPLFELLEPHGLSNEQVNTLRAMLRQTVDDNEGFLVIGLMASTVVDYLTDLSPRSTGSFHDHMLANNAKIEAEKNRQRKDTERAELEQIDEEMANRAPPQQPKKKPHVAEEVKKFEGVGRVHKLLNIPVNRPKLHSCCTEYFGFLENTHFLISEWAYRYNIQPRGSNKISKSQDPSKLRNFQPFFEKLGSTCAIIENLIHVNTNSRELVRYGFVEVEKIVVQPDSIDIRLYVGQKIHATERTLSSACELISSQPNLLRTLAAQSLFAIRSLHDLNFCHTNLTPGNVWVSECQDSCTFRISDYTSSGPLLELEKLFTEICSNKRVIDETQKTVKDQRKHDFFQLGAVLDYLRIKSEESLYPDGKPQDLKTDTLTDFIKACQEGESMGELVNHQFLQEDPDSDIHNQLFAPCEGSEMNRTGRLRSEFLVLRRLGKGGFGDVVSVRNKLDMTEYAVKRVPFESNRDKASRRTLKEAKHIAQLNHPNMVRYFNTWVEDCVPKERTSESSTDDDCAVPIPGKQKQKRALKTARSLEEERGEGDSLLPINLQKLVATPVSKGAEAREWSTNKSLVRRNKGPSVARLNTFSEDSSDEDGEYEEEELDEIDWDAPSEENVSSESSDDPDAEEERQVDDSDNVFTRSSTSKSVVEDDEIDFYGSATEARKRAEEEEAEEIERLQEEMRKKDATMELCHPTVLCIQMEFCDGGTLRHRIDDNTLLNNRPEAWRIFAEILCGLKYLHESRIIHRDIKPLNIFLMRLGGVKIGDFGLATYVPMNPTKKKKVVSGAEKSTSVEAVLSPTNFKKKDTQQTKDVGTQMYMAPELFATSEDDKYDFKVDIYSAGIVMFEMFYRPLTGMERASTLNGLRDALRIPDDFGKCEPLDDKMTALVKKTVLKMIALNPEERPTAEALLVAEELPMHTKEDNLFKELCQKVVKKRDGRMNAWLLDQQFNEDVPQHINFRYDLDMCLERYKHKHRETLVETLRGELCKILKVHAFEKVHPHTLIPVPSALANTSEITKPVMFLDRSGTPVALAMDLRQNFVRYCVRNGVERLKRFNFGRVYSENTAGLHPREKWECSVDCIGPQSSSTSLDAELMFVACEMMAKALPGMKLTLRIGHARLLDAQTQHLKLDKERRESLLSALHTIGLANGAYTQRQKFDLLSEALTGKVANEFQKLMSITDNTFKSFKDKVNSVSKKLDESAKQIALNAISDLEEIIATFKLCRTDDLKKIDIVYDAQLCYRWRTFADGIIFQITADMASVGCKKGRKYSALHGGRYDGNLIAERRQRDFVFGTPLCINGFAIDLDCLASMRECCEKQADAKSKVPKPPKVLVCSKEQLDGSSLLLEKFALAKKLWALGIPADVFHNPVGNLQSMNDHCAEAAITHNVVLSTKTEVLVMTGNGTSKLDIDQIPSFICRDTQTLALHNNQTPNAMATTPEHEEHTTPVMASRSASSSHISGGLRASSATVSNLNVILLTGERTQKSFKDKKRAENQVASHFADLVGQYSSKTKIDVIVVDFLPEIIKKISSEITKTSTPAEIDAVFDLFAHQHRADFSQLQKQIHNSIHGSSSGFGAVHVVILYNHTKTFYRCLS